MANKTQTIPFNYNELLQECKNLFNEVGFDTSDGSNTSQLSGVLSYLVASLNTNTAININETLLPYATKRKNILQDARVLGYEAQHVTSFQYKLKIRLSYDLIGHGTIEIPRYTEFQSNGNSYYFFNNTNIENANGLFVNLGTFKTKDKSYMPSQLTFSFDEDSGYIESAFVTETNDPIINVKEVNEIFINNRDIEMQVKEGTFITYENDVNSLERTIDSITVNGNTYTRNYIDIPYTNVENDGVFVYVSYYDNYGNYQSKIPYTRSKDYFFETDSNQNGSVKHKFLRLDDIEMGTPRIYFSHANLGDGLPFGSLVQMIILQSNGTNGNISYSTSQRVFSLPTKKLNSDNTYTVDTETLNVFDEIKCPSLPSGTLGSSDYIADIFSDANIIGVELLVSGSEEESNKSIINNAPKVYNSAHRLITNLDYKSACNRSTYVLDSAVWGGEDEFPRSQGHIWFSFIPNKITERTFTSNSSNTEYQRNNSQLVYNYLEGESVYQHKMRQEFYNKNYLLDTEIKSYKTYEDENGVAHQEYSGVWGDLTDRYVPSLTFHHRHPLYMNFNYEFNILKYNLKDTTQNVHNQLFNALNNCFYGNDSLNIESYDVEYFHTNIVKRIDTLISDLCGFTSSLTTNIMLNEKTCCTENWKSNYKDIYIPLCVPYEKYFSDDGFLDTSRLPSIDTENFIDFKFDVIIDPLDIYGIKTTDLNGFEEYNEYNGKYISKYNSLRYSVVKGDLYTDWSLINEKSNNNRLLSQEENRDIDIDYTDLNTKVFVAPIKIKMKYEILITKDFIDNHNAKTDLSYIELGFNLAPTNTKDETFDNIKYTIYSDYGTDNQSVYKSNNQIKPHMIYDDDNRNRISIKKTLKFNYTLNADKTISSTNNDIGKVLVVEFERTCGYYYLFNSFKKEILIHLFVNGDVEGFGISKNAMRYNKYYDAFNEELSSTWKEQESRVFDDTCYMDITYSTPRSYLTTSDRKYISFGTEQNALENTSPMTFNQDTLLGSYTTLNQTDEDKGFYLTTEGYLVSDSGDFSDVSYYVGEIVRNYNEDMYEYTPLTFDLFRQNVYLNVKYPSFNFQVHKNVIPRLNNVKFKNASESY